MATTIDTLVVELVLAVDKFKKGAKEAQDLGRKTKDQTRESAKEWEGLTKRADDALMSLGRRALGVAGVLAGGLGIEQLIAKFVPMNAELGRTAHFLGISARDLLIWQSAGRTVGATAEEITGNFEALTNQVEQFKLGMRKETVAQLNQLGISLKTPNNEWKSAAEIFKEISAGINRTDPKRAAAIANLLGITPGMRNLLAVPDLQATLTATAKLIGDSTEENVKAAQRLQKEWANAQTALENLGRSIGTFIEGPATDLLRWMQELPQKWEDRIFGEKGTLTREVWDKGWREGLLGPPGGPGQTWWNWGTTSGLHARPGETAAPSVAPSAANRNAPVSRRRPTGMGPGGTFTDQYGTWQLHPELESNEPVLPPPGAAGKGASMSTNINVASMVVHSRADNAAGIAGDIRDELMRRVAMQADYGQA